VLLTSAEQELLVACARLELSPALRARIRTLIETPIRWGPLLDAAERHGVTPLVHTHLRSLAPDGAIPAGARLALFGAFHRGTSQSLRQERELRTLLDRFSAAGVAVIVLKGPDLAERVYGDLQLRWSADLDLLIRRDDVDGARALLLAAGYRVAPTILSERFARRHHFNLPFERADGIATLVELHWALTDRFTAGTWDLAGLWTRAREVTLAGRPALVLADEDLVTHLAVHADVHGYLNRALVSTGIDLRVLFHPLSGNRLVWFTDLSEFLAARGGALDWPSLVARARAAGVGEAVATTLALVNALFGPVVPSAVLRQLGEPRASLVKRRLLTRLAREIERGEAAGDGAARSWLTRLVETRQDVQFRLVRLLDLWEYVLPPRDVLRRRYRLRSTGAACAVYPVHVARALGACAARATEMGLLMLARSAMARIGRPVKGRPFPTPSRFTRRKRWWR
jgi:hypothetical protein